jgi:hypothetical protein
LGLFFRGDRRAKYGRAVTDGRHRGTARSSQFYPLYVHGREVGGFPHGSCQDELKREAIIEALEHVERATAEMGVFVDLTAEKALLDALDLTRLLRE